MAPNRMLLVLGLLGMATRLGSAPLLEGASLPFPNAAFGEGAAGWTLCPMSTVSDGQAAVGNHSLLTVDRSRQDGSSARGPRLPVTEPGRFEISGQVFPVSGDGLGIYVEFFDAAGERLRSSRDSHVLKAPSHPQNEWVRFRGDFWSPEGVAYMQVWIHSYSMAEVEAYIDDLQIRFVQDMRARLAAWAESLDVVRERLLERVQGGTAPVDVGTLASAQLADGSWPDVDYEHRERTIWRAAQHTDRLLVLARAYRRGATDPDLDRESLAEAIRRGLDFWYGKDPQNPNWWWNVIGIPRTMYRILLLAEPALDAERLAQGCRILERARLGMTGQNLVWVAECTIARGCLERDPTVVGLAFAAIAGEIRISVAEGIQPDYSFHQHGDLLYSGGYGKGFSIDVPQFAALAGGTAFAFSEEQMDILVRYLLDGQQWMVRNQVFDYSVTGRELVRPGAASSRGLERACDDLATLDHPRTDELRAFARRLRQGIGEDTPALFGHRHFWRSEYAAHHRPAYFASVRLASRRVQLSETVNDENLRGEHLSDGVNFLYRSGEEYRRMMPVWDWRKLPGITAEQVPSPPGRVRGRGEGSFAGGLADGQYGLAAMDFTRGGLAARKAWFFFDDEYVCLGAGIRSGGGHPVATTLNQCLLQGEVWTDGGRLPRGEHRLDRVGWLHHDQVAYLLPEPGPLRVRLDEQTGSWRQISAPQSDRPVAMDVFSAWVDHGVDIEDGGYAYVVVPGIERDRVAAYAAALPVQILANRADLQAVAHPGLRRAQMVFHVPGSCPVPGFGTVAVDQPCVLQVAWSEEGVQLALANPEHSGLEVVVSLPGRRVPVTLPDGPERGGSTVLVSLAP